MAFAFYRVMSSRELYHVIKSGRPRVRHYCVQVFCESAMSTSSSLTMVPQMSSYFEGLLEEDKRRYKSKIELINGNESGRLLVGGSHFVELCRSTRVIWCLI